MMLWSSGYQYCAASFNKVWTQVLRNVDEYYLGQVLKTFNLFKLLQNEMEILRIGKRNKNKRKLVWTKVCEAEQGKNILYKS